MAKTQRPSPIWRRLFLRSLKATGNVRRAAAEAGVDHGTAYAHRRKDARFAARWERVLAGRRDGSNRPSPQPCGRPARPPDEPQRRQHPAGGRGSGDSGTVLRRSKRHGVQVVKAAKGRWSAGAERVFLDRLGETGCIRRAARAAGFSTTAVHNRLNLYPSFAAKAQAAIRRARTDLEAMVLSAGIATFDPGVEDEDALPLPKITISEAIAYLRLNPSAKGAAKGQEAEEPDVEAVRAEILRRLDAIEAHDRGEA